MAEVALGALGVVPLVGLMIKSYRATYSNLKTFRHCDRIVGAVYKRFRTQRRIFENECELLLRSCLGNQAAVQIMMADPDHDFWRKGGHDKAMRRLLNLNYDDYNELLRQIHGLNVKLNGKLQCFQVVKLQRRQGEKIKDTWRRIRDGLRIVVKKTDYEDSLASLRNANGDLKTIREQIYQLQQPYNPVPAQHEAERPEEWSHVRLASRALHEALTGVWSCNQSSHQQHFLKLFLEAENAAEEVQMNIAIMCRDHDGNPALMQLSVRSQYLDEIITPSPRLLTASAPSENGRPRERVRFSGTIATTYVLQQARPNLTPKLSVEPSQNLKFSSDFCSKLMTTCDGITTDLHPRCLGYLDVQSDKRFRHLFYSLSQDVPRANRETPFSARDLVSLDKIVSNAMDDIILPLDRLKMAKAVVLAVLNFHETPWLGEAWRLQDLSFFSDGPDLDQSLRTLHVDVEVHDARTGLSSARLMPASDDERLSRGIYNMTLHSLAVALLEIDRLEVLHSDDVGQVRRRARLGCMLGPQYQEIVQQCLRCDFRCGTDLRRSKLQKAVYESVIGGLETLISDLVIDK